MTVHQAKGMEAPIVIVDGYSFFLFRGSDLETGTYEMARVMYVALSRAESELYLVTDGRPFPNMQGVYEAIDKQWKTSFADDECPKTPETRTTMNNHNKFLLPDKSFWKAWIVNNVRL